MNYMTNAQSNSSCRDAEGMSAPSVRVVFSSDNCASSENVCNNGAVAVIAAAAFLFVLSLCLYAFIISGIIIISSIIILLAIAALIIRITGDNRIKRKGNCRA